MIELVDNNGFSIGVYEDETIINNHKSNGYKEVPVCDEVFYIKKWDKSINKWVEGLTIGEINEINYQETLRLETEKYVQRSKDGRLAYAEISAEFRLAKLNGIISEESHASIEKALISVTV